ncbi:MAG: hypothetical protein HDQ87_01435 [Clostridia bacterium]|nr:hypothetical protein [Clostridia bacterium]
MSTEKKQGPSIEIIVKVTQEDGTVVEKTVETSSERLPAQEDFDITTKEGFLRDFDTMESHTFWRQGVRSRKQRSMLTCKE